MFKRKFSIFVFLISAVLTVLLANAAQADNYSGNYYSSVADGNYDVKTDGNYTVTPIAPYCTGDTFVIISPQDISKEFDAASAEVVNVSQEYSYQFVSNMYQPTRSVNDHRHPIATREIFYRQLNSRSTS